MVGAYEKPSCGRAREPIHSILYSLPYLSFLDSYMVLLLYKGATTRRAAIHRRTAISAHHAMRYAVAIAHPSRGESEATDLRG